MQHGVRQLHAPYRLEVREQVEVAAVVRPVVRAAERSDTIWCIAAAQRSRDQVRRVDREAAAQQARLAGHLGPLLGTGQEGGRGD